MTYVHEKCMDWLVKEAKSRNNNKVGEKVTLLLPVKSFNGFAENSERIRKENVDSCEK